MPIVNGVWVPTLFKNGVQVFNSTARALLVSGPSLSGKSIAVLNKIVRHMWETPQARVAFFSRTIKNSKDGGSWSTLHEFVMPEWLKSGIGINYTTKSKEGTPGPRVDGTTRTPQFAIRNYYGTESQCMLFSLDHTDDIEDKIKEQSFSMIYFSELDKFDSRKVLSISLPRLRMPHLKMNQQMFMGDTNPSEKGEKSWIYQTWYLERTMDYETYLRYCEKKEIVAMREEQFKAFQQGLELIEMMPEDNPFLEPAKLEELKAQYSYDNDLYARYVLGKWVFGHGDSSRHFKEHFKQHHILGDCSALDEKDWEIALPSQLCYELITGWDIGDGVNHAMVCLESVSAGIGSPSHYVVLDENESTGTPLSTEDFTLQAMQKIVRLESMCGHPLDLERAWSDNSLFRYDAHADTYPYLEVAAASGGRIQLQAMEQIDKSIRIRVQLVKKLLSQNRLHVSAHCVGVIRMLKELKKGSTAKTDYIVNDENKHLFDALTYALIKECSEELTSLAMNPQDSVGKRSESTFISV